VGHYDLTREIRRFASDSLESYNSLSDDLAFLTWCPPTQGLAVTQAFVYVIDRLLWKTATSSSCFVDLSRIDRI
jgi:hypothetical protein